MRGKLAPYEYPKEIEFIDALPMTTTGKVQRRVLRLREEEKAKAPRSPDRRRLGGGLALRSEVSGRVLDLAAHLAARVGGGVQVDVPEALLDLVDLRRRSASPSR